MQISELSIAFRYYSATMADKPAKRSPKKNYYLRMPLELHRNLTKRAGANRRSLAQEIIFLLEAGAKAP